MKKIFILIITLAFIGISVSNAQETRVNTTNTNAWFMYFGNHKLSDNWGLHLEAQLRRADLVSDPAQLLLRAGIDYYTKSGRLTFGGAFVETHPYGEFAVAHRFPEFRLWEQFLTTQSFGNVKLAHRFRLEQRFIGSSTDGTMENGRYENRFRYMARITVPLNGEAKTPLYVAGYDELMVNFGKEVAYNIFDQNRLYAALGIGMSPALKIELGYMYQIVVLRSLSEGRNRVENNHTLQVALFSTLPFRKSE
jgi:hypothetical protein